MEQYEKTILAALCEGLPHNLICDFYDDEEHVHHEAVLITVHKVMFKDWKREVIDISGQSTIIGDNTRYVYSLHNVKPYLRPMSSMTNVEKLEFESITNKANSDKIKNVLHWDFIGETQYFELNWFDVAEIVEWLNAHHFDYKKLIQKGLAYAATENMYNIKNQ